MKHEPGPDVVLARCDHCTKKDRLFELSPKRWICPSCFRAVVEVAVSPRKENNDAAT